MRYNKSKIMSRAWSILKRFPNLTFKQCLTRSWAIEKKNMEPITPSQFNAILNGLRTFNRSLNSEINKPLLHNSEEHFRFLNSKKGRKIIKDPKESETKTMLTEGEFFFSDILRQRRMDSLKYTFKPKQKTKFRNRIVNLENCVKINVEEFINGENR